MGAHQFAGVGLRSKQRQFAAEDGGSANGGEAACVLAGRAVFAATEGMQVRFDSVIAAAFAVADAADDEVRQGAAEIEVVAACFGVDDALRAFDDVCRVLAGGEVEGEEDVGEVGVRATDAAGEFPADVVFAQVQRADFFRRGAQHPLAEAARDGNFGDDVFATAEDAVHRAGFFVGAVVGGDRTVGEFGMGGKDVGKHGIGGFGHHVVPGGVASCAFEAEIEQVADDLVVQVEQAGEAACFCDDGGKFVTRGEDVLQRGVGGGGIGRFEQDAARHAVVNQGAAHTTAVFGDFRAARGGGPERGFVGSERDADGVVHGVAADSERPDPLGRDGGDVGLLAGHILLVLQEFPAQQYSTRAFSLDEAAGKAVFIDHIRQPVPINGLPNNRTVIIQAKGR